MWKLVVCAALALACLTPEASAQDRRENWRVCANKDRAPPDVAIKGCTAIIESGQESDVDLASAHYNRGIGFDDKKDYDRAITDYSEAIRLDPSDASHFYNRGNSLSAKGERDRAIADYSEAVRLKPDHANAFGNRGNQWMRKGQYEKAVADYSSAIGIDPRHANSLGSRCWANVRLDRLAAALADCDAVLKLRPDDANDRDSRGFVHLRLGHHDKAIEDYDAAIGVARIATSLYGRGIARQRKGDATGAAADIAAATAIQPDIAREMARYGLK